jgi:eukaryotic-like serine/threonine-protein kinase
LYTELLKKTARALAEVRHENVVQVHALGPHANSFYLAMRHVAGRSLASVMAEHAARSARLELPRALEIVRGIARGLSAVHARGLVHRDVSPRNVMIEQGTTRPVLVDFGLALTAEGHGCAPHAPHAPSVHLAPEQASGDEAAVSPRTDLYGLARTTYELLSGRPALGPRISARRPALGCFDTVLARALAKSPGDRHASCDAFLEELEAAAHELLTRRKLGSASPAPPPALRVVILETDESLRRQVVRIVDRIFRRPGDAVEIEHVTSVAALGAACRHASPHIVLVDEDSTAGATAGLLRGIAEAVSALSSAPDVLLLRRSFDTAPWTLDGKPVREVPKPVNAQVLASVLNKMAMRMAERLRSSGPSPATRPTIAGEATRQRLPSRG